MFLGESVGLQVLDALCRYTPLSWTHSLLFDLMFDSRSPQASNDPIPKTAHGRMLARRDLTRKLHAHPAGCRGRP
jgi:hypothetical protein